MKIRRIATGIILVLLISVSLIAVDRKNNSKNKELENVTITLGVKPKCDSEDVLIKDNILFINKGGMYDISGVLVNGKIYIDTEDEVTLNFKKATITNELEEVINNRASSKLNLNFDDVNIFSDGSRSRAAILSSGDTLINGMGSLLIYGNGSKGIIVNGSLEINNITLYITALKDAISVKDSYLIKSGIVVGLGNGLMQMPSDSSTQNTFLFNFDKTIPEETNIGLFNDKREEVMIIKSLRSFKTMTLSMSDLKKGSYYLVRDFNYDGKLVNGLYEKGRMGNGERLRISIADTFKIENRNNWYGNINIMTNSFSDIQLF